MYLVGDRLQRGPDDVVFVHAPGNTHNSSSGVLIPMRRPKAGEGRNHVAAVGILHFFCHILGILCRIDQPQLIPQPLDRRSGHEDGTLQRIIHLSVQSPGNGGDQPVSGEYRLFSGVHKQETACSIGILRFPRLKTGLTEQRRLLVSRCPGNRNGSAQIRRICLPVYAT